MAVKVNLRSGIGRFGLIVRVGGYGQAGHGIHSAKQNSRNVSETIIALVAFELQTPLVLAALSQAIWTHQFGDLWICPAPTVMDWSCPRSMSTRK